LQGTEHPQIKGQIHNPLAVSLASVAILTGSLQAAVQFQGINMLDLGFRNASVPNMGAVTQSAFPCGTPANLGGINLHLTFNFSDDTFHAVSLTNEVDIHNLRKSTTTWANRVNGAAGHRGKDPTIFTVTNTGSGRPDPKAFADRAFRSILTPGAVPSPPFKVIFPKMPRKQASGNEGFRERVKSTQALNTLIRNSSLSHGEIR
jgi:hypothetical protein